VALECDFPQHPYPARAATGLKLRREPHRSLSCERAGELGEDRRSACSRTRRDAGARGRDRVLHGRRRVDAPTMTLYRRVWRNDWRNSMCVRAMGRGMG
jgi:hypothetical protein